MGGYVVGIDKSRLEGAPVLAVDETSRLEDEAYGRQFHDYYGTRPVLGLPCASLPRLRRPDT